MEQVREARGPGPVEVRVEAVAVDVAKAAVDVAKAVVDEA